MEGFLLSTTTEIVYTVLTKKKKTNTQPRIWSQ